MPTLFWFKFGGAVIQGVFGTSWHLLGLFQLRCLGKGLVGLRWLVASLASELEYRAAATLGLWG